MTLLERVIRAHRCRSTHHFIAFDALSLVSGDEGEAWKSLFLVHHEHLLAGAKAPDTTFKDFKNHVLHVQEGEWGGARAKATEWYARAVELLSKKRWSDAAYALGVLSHYYADPIQPFHTGQTEAEGVIHRAVEWSIAKSRPDIDERIAEIGYPEIEIPDGPAFVSDMVRQGAEMSNAYYDVFIDHYDIHAGVADPPSGLDDTMREAIAELVAYATAGFAAILERAIEEAAVAPPKVHLTLQGYIETLDIPLRWITAKLEDMGDRRQVERMYKEYQKTGKVIRTLPEDDKVIRELHAKEVRRISLKALNAEPITPLGTAREPEPEIELEDEIELTGDAAASEDAAEIAEYEEDLETEAVEDDEEEYGLEAEDEADDEDEFEDEAELEEEVDDEDEAEEAELEADEDEYDDEEEAGLEAGEEDDAGLEEDELEEADQIEAEAEPEPAIPARRAYLTWESPVVDAPSIGAKTAKQLRKAGIETVGDLLICDPEETAELLNVRYITVDALETWQLQATLMIEVPGLRVHDAQLLVGAGITSREDLMNASAATIFELAMEFIESPEGGHVLRSGQTLEAEEIEDWIGMAREATA